MIGGSSERHAPTWWFPVRRTRGVVAAGRVLVVVVTAVKWLLRRVIATFGSLLAAVSWALAATAVVFLLLALLLRCPGG